MKSILLYHNIAPAISPYGSVVNPKTFRKHLRFLKYNGIKILSPEEFQECDSGVMITFDDGFDDIYKYAYPILLEQNINALVFVVSAFAGKKNDWDVSVGKNFTHMNWNMVKEMHRNGIKIGSHSHRHPDYSRIPPQEVEKDLKISYEIISDKIGESISYLSYPFGRAPESIFNIVRNTGYKKAYTSIPVKCNNPYFTGRWGVYTIDNLYTLSLKTGIKKKVRGIEYFKCRTINWFSNGTGVIKKWKK